MFNDKTEEKKIEVRFRSHVRQNCRVFHQHTFFINMIDQYYDSSIRPIFNILYDLENLNFDARAEP